jgi:transcriptional regulator with GAF, ATPase, and Fis domain
MSQPGHIMAKLPEGEKNIVSIFLAFTDFFSVDWFAGSEELLPSQIISVISFLEKKHWAEAIDGKQGFYRWTSKVPRDEIVGTIPPDMMSRCYRRAVDILKKYLPDNEESILKIADQCILAGLREEDLDVIIRAAMIEESHHRISSAITLYDHILEFIEHHVVDETDPSRELCCRFIQSIERRATLSVFYPNVKKTNRLLSMALDTAVRIGDLRAQASLQLLIGQNCWMSFQHEKALYHFDLGWEMINRQDIDDDSLRMRGLQLQGMAHWTRGELSMAIEAYEHSLGELDSLAEDDFSFMTALNLALGYSYIGLPQRGLGISETIYNQARKNENWPIASFALGTSGMIFLEMRQLQNSRTYFEMSLELARKEHIPMAEIIAGMGIANIECLQKNFKEAETHFRVRWIIRKSSWFHILNVTHSFEAFFRLYREGYRFDDLIELKLPQYLYSIKHEQHRLMYCIIRRLQLELSEEEKSPREKIEEFLTLETLTMECGATFETAKIHVNLAILFLQTNNWKDAERFAREAWEYLKHTARDVFPSELAHLIPRGGEEKDHRLFDLITGIGEAISNQTNLETLLANTIIAISRYTRSERSALFMKEKEGDGIRMVASRNLLMEHFEDESFTDTKALIREVINGAGDSILYRESGTDDSFDSRRIIVTPLKLAKKVFGALYLDSRFFPADLNGEQRSLLSAMAPQIAVSIDRAQAHEEIARLNERLIEENRYYIEEKEEFRPFGEIIGASKAMADIHRLIKRVAPTPSTVLILGETGVGKELIARAIHRQSKRNDGPFIRVNCAALPETLIDSELFGHEKGAFTGAIKTKAGRFELAHKGTIFLDEVSELPLQTQSRLLRILQEKEFQRVGGTKTLYSDFRLIAATNQDLKYEVADGRFRADLFYRLNVFPIFVPPLRERKKDIPLLAAHFLKLFSSQYNRNYEGIPELEMEKMKAYSWPGNIRELANMVEHAVILGEKKIRFPELGGHPVEEQTDDEGLVTLRDMERTHILKALKETNGIIGGPHGAAALLGLKRTTLINRMKKLGITLERRAL